MKSPIHPLTNSPNQHWLGLLVPFLLPTFWRIRREPCARGGELRDFSQVAGGEGKKDCRELAGIAKRDAFVTRRQCLAQHRSVVVGACRHASAAKICELHWQIESR